MIKGVHDFYYNVMDMNKSIEFYTNVLNMKVQFKSEHWTSLDCEGVMIGLHWNGGSEVPRVPRDAHGAHSGGTLTLSSDNVSEDRKILEESGATIIGEADEDWGHMLIFEDPDGNVLKLQKQKY